MSRYLFLALALRHAGWGLLLLLYPQEIGATPLAVFARWMAAIPWPLWLRPRLPEALCYLVAAALALRFASRRLVTAQQFAWLAAPQIFLILCACQSSLSAVWRAQYADGVPRHWAFILADQSPLMTFGLCMLLAFWHYYYFYPRWAQER